MKLAKRSGLLLGAGLLLAGALSGCGSSSSNSVPAAATTFYTHSAFANHSTAVTSGFNAFGQIGDGSLNNRASFLPVAGLGKVAGVAAGANHTLAIVFNNTTSNVVMAWGSDQFGQLGNNNSGGGVNSSVPVRAGSLRGVTHVAAGGFHSLAIANKSVFAWGDNSSGELGDGTFVQKNVPTAVIDPANGVSPLQALQVAAGGLFSLALVDDGSGVTGDVWAWGDNTYGQLAIDPTVASSKPSPVKINGLPAKIKLIAAAGSFCLAVDSANNIWAWGHNGFGQLGQNPIGATKAFNPTPTQITLDPALNVQSVVKIVAGLDHVLVLVADPTGATKVLAWGSDFFGELGHNKKISTSHQIDSNVSTFESFTPVVVLDGSGTTTGNGSGATLTGVTDIFAFGHSSLARSNGKLIAWGDNVVGQLGFTDTTQIGFQENPKQVPGI